ncbi:MULTISPECIES: GAF domain-containing protein [unclassified Phenylobacterium]|uniref:GAF domain-containing protein n=1 Tax=unclassified Phenylobacterium TaxID=2640670 RepID=UPI0009EABC5A|nr:MULTISPECIES: GAF domain-containing protein [unclassified Phenylobacterium]
MNKSVDQSSRGRHPPDPPGAIQPHGAMLVCDPVSYLIQFASENLGMFVAGADQNPIGADLASVIGPQAAHDVRNAAAKAGGSQFSSAVLAAYLPGAAGLLDLAVRRSNDRIFIEIEPSSPSDGNDALNSVQALIQRVDLESDVASIAGIGARLVRGFLGYDQVLVLRFLHNGIGLGIAEAKRPSLDSLLGQRFPASDFPDRDRRLYLANTIQMISDARRSPVALTPALTKDEAPIDLSLAHLRSVTSAHRKHLEEIGVCASFSISLIVEGELWGLIDCYHASPRLVPLSARIGAELFGRFVSLQISLAEARDQIASAELARERLDNLVARPSSKDALADNLRDHLPDSAGIWTSFDAEPSAHDLGDGAKVKDLPARLRTTFPASITPAGPAPVTHTAASPGAGSLDGLDILLVEDQVLVAMDVEETLRRLGARNVCASSSVADADAALASFTPHVAVLDFDLGVETSEVLADSLQARGVPFIFATGYGEGASMPARFAHVPIVPKPISTAALAAKIAEVRPRAWGAEASKDILRD